VPTKTIFDIPMAAQAKMLEELRAVRYGYFSSIHILLLLSAGKTPTEIASFLFCSRSSVYRAKAAYEKGDFSFYWQTERDHTRSRLTPPRGSWHESVVSYLKLSPKFFGWCRTRWSCAALSLQLKTRRAISLSRETIRRTLHQLGFVYKRARHIALDNDPERAVKLARIRQIIESLPTNAPLFFADELDIHLLPKLGSEWMRRGTQTEALTPGQNQKAYLAAAWNYVTGKVLSVTGEKKDRHLFINLLESINRSCGATKFQRVSVVVDNYRIHTAKDVAAWLAHHPRFELVFLPSYCPRANPIERIFGDCHDQCTRNHKRKRLSEVAADVVWHLKARGRWRYKLSTIYEEEAVTNALAQLPKEAMFKAA
jgi:transposase